MPYVEAAVTIFVALALAWLADLITGRRDLPGFVIVALTGAAGGAFLALRVFSLATIDSWLWPMGAGIGAVAAIVLYFLFRKQR
ncbi:MULTISPECIES: transglycosylase [unclassified Brevundimonas]|uniref:transglycosylase n=1 Tax=unclassified Brevundimonas TaxID=2622653 RepID=UPI0025C2845B|nr:MULTISPECIES: transglycosylase [unclassified Brevundimonas]